MTLADLITKHEGLRLKPYFDCCGKFFRECRCEKQGKLSIGVGRNIEEVGLSAQEACYLRDNDIEKVRSQADAAFPWFKELSEFRRWAVIDMIYNLGIMGFLGFRGMIAAIQKKDYDKAAFEMSKSLWSKQVGQRALDDEKMMREDKLP